MKQPRLEDYKVGWITALPTEAAAAKAMLDKTHPRLPTPHDSNVYTFGFIRSGQDIADGGHNIVIASGRPGTATAATIANDMRRTFPWLRIGLMVGIAGGVWSPDIDVRLGDVVVGVHPKSEAGVIHYDYGRQVQDKGFLKTGAMNKAPPILLNAVAAVQAEHKYTKASSRAYVTHLDQGLAKINAARPPRDRLFNSTYIRVRPERSLHPTIPNIHYGPIASGNRLIRDAVFAEEIRQKYGNLCFEMEPAGLDDFPSLTVRGISDYCDTHKNDDWHDYAAIAAAAYARELLSVIPPTEITQLPQLGNTHWIVPRRPNSLFMGRRELLNDMTQHLVTESKKNDRSVFVLQGMGGAGKSEVAIKFAAENRDNFWGIFWIDADNKRSIEQGFAKIAKNQVPPLQDATPENVLEWLANIDQSWLLILDNCDNANEDYSGYIPSHGGSIIVTTRLQECSVFGTWKNIDELDEESATQLLLKASGIADACRTTQQCAAKSIVRMLGHHALALVHAGAYIKKGLCTLDEYVLLFHREKSRLMRFEIKQQASRYGSVYATFEVSAKALASSQDYESHLALRLLNILAFLDREAVEEESFTRASKGCYEVLREWEDDGMLCHRCATISRIEHDRSPERRSKPDTGELAASCVFEHGIDDDEDENMDREYLSQINHLHIWHCEKVCTSDLLEHQATTKLRIARARLADLSLIKVDDNKMFMHPLVHEWARTRMNQAAWEDTWEQTDLIVYLSDFVRRDPATFMVP
ncbi:hypothetical protein QM012_002145 [Aureobasidium pullulans]|uniref:Purine and uridine phosphorylase n=1 Tax=Aureobasidium pullulans TaxID=5580 RepID=A0ABR0TCJ3_AURPU